MRDRRVLRLITRLNIGGPARQALMLTRELAEAWPTTLAAGYPATREGELSDPAVAVHRLPLVRPLRPREDRRALAETRRLIQGLEPAVVHTHMAKAGTIGRLAVNTVRDRPRTVHTFHGHVLDGYFSPPAQRAFVATERLLARRTDVLVAVSPEIRDQLLDLRIGRAEQFRVLPLGLDLDAHLRVEASSGTLRAHLGLGEDVPLVGCVGRLVPIKDHRTLLEAMRMLPEVHLAILGDGELRPELEGFVAEGGLASRVHFTGWWTDVPAAMGDLDVVALASLNEGTPVSLIEASACARPVVATDVGGVRSVVDDGETGFVVPPSDATALSSAIRRLLDDKALAHQLGAAGRSRSHRFMSRRLVADIVALYEELVR